jgi:fructokinase
VGTDGPVVVVAGEALIDLAPDGDRLRPLPGGSPYNVAVGLGRLGTSVGYLGRCSTDGFGHLLTHRLAEAGVALDAVVGTNDPTTLAVVHLDDDARATYGFYLAGTSAAGLTGAALPDLGDATALHVSLGAVTLDTDPAGAAFRTLLIREAGRRTVSLDPNVRPSVIADLPGYARRLGELIATCDLVKVSDEDLTLLYPGEDPAVVARRWVDAGPVAVVVTRGPDGAVGWLADGTEVEVAGVAVEVVDTVGAGDAFTSGLLDALAGAGRLERTQLRSVRADELRDALRAAVRVAAVTCTRAGADPPTRDELAAEPARGGSVGGS